MTDRLTTIRSCGVNFLAVDPTSYPFAQYEFSDEAWVKDTHWTALGPGQVVIDLGASWGGYTLPALAQGARVVAVEPSPVSLAVLRASIAANGWTERATLLQAALWDGSPLPEAFRAAAIRNFGGDDGVGVLTLDELVDVLALERLDRIKFDVEGAELAIVRGGRAALQRFRPTLVIEDHDKPADAADAHLVPYAVGLRAALLEELRSLGYAPECVWQPGSSGGNPFIIARHTASHGASVPGVTG